MRKYKRRSSKKRRYAKRRRYARRYRRGLRADYSSWFRLPAGQVENDNLTVMRGQLTFVLSGIPNHTTYKNMFDQYRINKVIVKFTPRSTEVVNRPYDDATAGTPLLTPMFCAAVIRDDDALPLNYVDILNMQGSRERKMTQGMKWVFRPSVLQRLGVDNLYPGYSLHRPPWINTKYDNCPHYGLQYAITAGGTNRVFVHDIEIKMHVSFRRRKNP